MGKAFDNAKLFLSDNPTQTVNVVGHSLGGWQAAHLAQQLNEVRCDAMDNLITLDPVGTRYFGNASGPILKGSDDNGFTYSNVIELINYNQQTRTNCLLSIVERNKPFCYEYAAVGNLNQP